MPPEILKLLEDMRSAAREIADFTAGSTVQDYFSNTMLRRAVERCFAIIGEALTQVNKLDPGTAQKFTDYRKIISFRNVVIHAYAMIDHGKTWDIIVNDLPVLRKELQVILSASS